MFRPSSARARTHARVHICAHASMHICTHARMHICTHARVHICTHMHGCTYARTHTHTHHERGSCKPAEQGEGQGGPGWPPCCGPHSIPSLGPQPHCCHGDEYHTESSRGSDLSDIMEEDEEELYSEMQLEDGGRRRPSGTSHNALKVSGPQSLAPTPRPGAALPCPSAGAKSGSRRPRPAVQSL